MTIPTNKVTSISLPKDQINRILEVVNEKGAFRFDSNEEAGTLDLH